MKLAIFGVLAVLALATAGVQGNAVQANNAFSSGSADLGTAMELVLEAFKRIMPCGYEAFNIPVLAPYTLPYYQFNVSTDYVKAKGHVANMIVGGLNKYRVLGGSYNSTTQRFTYDMMYPEIQILAEEKVKEWLSIAGLPLNLEFDGLINLKFNDIRFVGEFSIVPNSQDPNTLEMKVHHMHYYVGQIISSNWNNKWNIAMNNFMNKWLAESLEMFNEQIQPVVTDLYRKYILPLDNWGFNKLNMEQLVEFYLSTAAQFNAADCQKTGDLF